MWDDSSESEEEDDGSLELHGVVWEVIDQVVEDRARQDLRKTRIHFPADGLTWADRNSLDYIKWAFPIQFIPDILAGTNEQLQHQNKPMLDEAEFWRFLGCLLIMCLFNFRDIRSWWTTKPGSSCVQRPNLKTTCGISRHRFGDITQCLRLGLWSPEDARKDPWIFIDGFVTAFNSRRLKGLTPGTASVVTIDFLV